MDQIKEFFPVISLILTGILGFNAWMKSREISELKLKHAQEINNLKHESSELIIVSKQSLKEERLLEAIKEIKEEVRYVRDKASKRHGYIQGMLGQMQLDIKEFETKYKTQIDELYRNGIGDRRDSNLKEVKR